jgi:hypothetical protein
MALLEHFKINIFPPLTLDSNIQSNISHSSNRQALKRIMSDVGMEEWLIVVPVAG